LVRSMRGVDIRQGRRDKLYVISDLKAPFDVGLRAALTSRPNLHSAEYGYKILKTVGPNETFILGADCPPSIDNK